MKHILSMNSWLVESKDAGYVDQMIAFSKNPRKTTRVVAASSPHTPADILKELSYDSKSDVRSAVAQNPNTPVDALEKLGRDEMWIVRSHTGTNPNISIEILIELANDDDYQVREGAAQNPNLPSDLVEKLSHDESVGVRRSIAGNQITSPEILRRLMKGGTVTRHTLALNPNLPIDLLIQLMSDSADFIKNVAEQSLETRKKTADPAELQRIEDALVLNDLGLLESRG